LFDFKHFEDWEPVSAAEYLNEVASRSIVVALAHGPALRNLLAALSAGWRERGRELQRSFPAMRLSAGDVLQVGLDIADLYFDEDALLELARQRPVKLMFHRLAGAPYKFVSPLLTVPGASLDTVSFCRLHTFDLGPVSVWNGVVLRRILKANVFGFGTHKHGLERSIARISQRLKKWRPADAPGAPRTWIKQIRLRNIGPVSKPFLKFRSGSASKSRRVLRFLTWFLRDHHQARDAKKLHGDKLLRCGESFLRCYDLFHKAESTMLSEDDASALAEAG